MEESFFKMIQKKIFHHLKVEFYFFFSPKKKKKQKQVFQQTICVCVYIYILLDMNFGKSTIKLHFLIMSSMLAKILEDKKSIAMSAIKCLYFKIL